jgi:hypothetical protein
VVPFKRGANSLFGGKEGWDALFLTGVENTDIRGIVSWEIGSFASCPISLDDFLILT